MDGPESRDKEGGQTNEGGTRDPSEGSHGFTYLKLNPASGWRKPSSAPQQLTSSLGTPTRRNPALGMLARLQRRWHAVLDRGGWTVLNRSPQPSARNRGKFTRDKKPPGSAPRPPHYIIRLLVKRPMGFTESQPMAQEVPPLASEGRKRRFEENISFLSSTPANCELQSSMK